MSRTNIRRWCLALGLLAVPAVLHAQASDSAARKTKQREVICRDGTTGIGAQGCASHGGVDAVTTNASQTGRASHDPVETGQVDTTPKPSGQAGPPPSTGASNAGTGYTGTANQGTSSTGPSSPATSSTGASNPGTSSTGASSTGTSSTGTGASINPDNSRPDPWSKSWPSAWPGDSSRAPGDSLR